MRRTHDTWRRQTARTADLPDNTDGLPHAGLAAARTIEEQSVVLIAEAERAGALDRTSGRLLLATGVLGYTVTEAGRMIGLDSDAAYRHRHRARAALRSWVEGRSDRSGTERRLPPRQPRPLPGIAVSPAASGDQVEPDSRLVAPLLLTPMEAAGLLRVSRSTMYALLKAGEIKSVTIGACRRVPHRDLVDYVEQRRRQDGAR